MAHYFPDFVVVIHPASTYPDAVVTALKINKATALNVLTYAEWLSHEPVTEHNLLYIRENGEMLYAKNEAEKLQIRREVESLS